MPGVVTYQVFMNSQCEGPWSPINTATECGKAAGILGHTQDCRPGACSPGSATSDRPPGCYGNPANGYFHFNPDPVGCTPPCGDGRGYICARACYKPYALFACLFAYLPVLLLHCKIPSRCVCVQMQRQHREVIAPPSQLRFIA